MKAKLIPATLDDYPAIQNMARFYVYEMSRECGLNSTDWACPATGLYESFDFKHYFVDPEKWAYLVKVNEELAGFVLLYQTGEQPNIQWHIGKFFILARFQNRDVGRMVAQQVWQQHPGSWEVTVIPENQRALQFWRKTVASVMQDNFIEELKLKSGRIDPDQPNRIVLTFDTTITTASQDKPAIRSAMADDIKSMVALSKQKRLDYEKAQPQFWRHAPDAEIQQTTWFNQLLEQDDHFLFVAEANIILLMGIAGTGKNTIGEEISKQGASFKLAHHHAWIDPILKLLNNNAAAAWQSLDEKGWGALNQARDVIFHTIAEVCPKESNFIITYEMLADNPYHQEFFDTHQITFLKHPLALLHVFEL